MGLGFRLEGGFGGAEAAAVWACAREALKAPETMFRAEEATFWACSALDLTLRIMAWMCCSLLASAQLNQEFRVGLEREC